MKIDLEPKDYVKILVYLGGAGVLGAGALSKDKSPERMAVFETKLERVQQDVAEIKSLILRRRDR